MTYDQRAAVFCPRGGNQVILACAPEQQKMVVNRKPRPNSREHLTRLIRGAVIGGDALELICALAYCPSSRGNLMDQ